MWLQWQPRVPIESHWIFWKNYSDPFLISSSNWPGHVGQESYAPSNWYTGVCRLILGPATYLPQRFGREIISTADSVRTVVSYWWKFGHSFLVKCLEQCGEVSWLARHNFNCWLGCKMSNKSSNLQITTTSVKFQMSLKHSSAWYCLWWSKHFPIQERRVMHKITW